MPFAAYEGRVSMQQVREQSLCSTHKLSRMRLDTDPLHAPGTQLSPSLSPAKLEDRELGACSYGR